MSSNDVSSLLADAEFCNDILEEQILDKTRFEYDVIKYALEQVSQSNNVEFVELWLVAATDDADRWRARYPGLVRCVRESGFC